MEIELKLFEVISTAIANFGLANTLISLILSLAVGYYIRSKVKSDKILTTALQEQTRAAENATDRTNDMLSEILRVNLSVLEITKMLQGQIEGAFSVITALTKKEVERERQGE